MTGQLSMGARQCASPWLQHGSRARVALYRTDCCSHGLRGPCWPSSRPRSLRAAGEAMTCCNFCLIRHAHYPASCPILGANLVPTTMPAGLCGGCRCALCSSLPCRAEHATHAGGTHSLPCCLPQLELLAPHAMQSAACWLGHQDVAVQGRSPAPTSTTSTIATSST